MLPAVYPYAFISIFLMLCPLQLEEAASMYLLVKSGDSSVAIHVHCSTVVYKCAVLDCNFVTACCVASHAAAP
jgi:hypothetical protein